MAGHRALYTPGILRAKTKAPYLVVQVCYLLCVARDAEHSSCTSALPSSAVCLTQVDSEGEAEISDKGWLPFGFFWIPSKSDTHQLAISDVPTQVLLARYLKVGVHDLLTS